MKSHVLQIIFLSFVSPLSNIFPFYAQIYSFKTNWIFLWENIIPNLGYLADFSLDLLQEVDISGALPL